MVTGHLLKLGRWSGKTCQRKLTGPNGIIFCRIFLKLLFLCHLTIDLVNVHGHLSITVICAASLGHLINSIFHTLPKASHDSDPLKLGSRTKTTSLRSMAVIWEFSLYPTLPQALVLLPRILLP